MRQRKLQNHIDHATQIEKNKYSQNKQFHGKKYGSIFVFAKLKTQQEALLRQPTALD